MTEAVILGAVRTAVGTMGGVFADVPATKLGAAVIAEALKRAGVSPDQVDEVLMGNVLQAGLGQNPARQASIAAGLPDSVPAATINKVCGSGLKTVILASQSVRLGDADIMVAGGLENMTRAPYLMQQARYGYRLGDGALVDSMVKDGLWCAIEDCHMGMTAEFVSVEFGVSRADMDAFAAESQARAGKAIAKGRFKDEILAIEVPKGRQTAVVDTDEHPRPDTTAERLGGLRAAFKPDGGQITAGNSSGINDGAAAMVVTTRETAEALGSKPMARIVSYASAGVAPRIMGMGPVGAIRRALEKADLSINDIDLIELNEAFAAQSVAVLRELDLDSERVNVNGGAIAIGHPIGASGARVLTTLLYEMQKRGSRYGLAALCIGGGQGIAMIVERER
ncbi:MAG: acetyl-CoA C-acetyltransferase [Dehalococcoidia bacterium]|nr:acetyl-CoA C-acetyltransferase [Dehalococcoidia bacterium]